MLEKRALPHPEAEALDVRYPHGSAFSAVRPADGVTSSYGSDRDIGPATGKTLGARGPRGRNTQNITQWGRRNKERRVYADRACQRASRTGTQPRPTRRTLAFYRPRRLETPGANGSAGNHGWIARVYMQPNFFIPLPQSPTGWIMPVSALAFFQESSRLIGYTRAGPWVRPIS